MKLTKWAPILNSISIIIIIIILTIGDKKLNSKISQLENYHTTQDTVNTVFGEFHKNVNTLLTLHDKSIRELKSE